MIKKKKGAAKGKLRAEGFKKESNNGKAGV